MIIGVLYDIILSVVIYIMNIINYKMKVIIIVYVKIDLYLEIFWYLVCMG